MFKFTRKTTADKNLRQFQEIDIGEPFLIKEVYFMKTSYKEAVPLKRLKTGEVCVHTLPFNINVKCVTLEVTDITE